MNTFGDCGVYHYIHTEIYIFTVISMYMIITWGDTVGCENKQVVLFWGG